MDRFYRQLSTFKAWRATLIIVCALFALMLIEFLTASLNNWTFWGQSCGSWICFNIPVMPFFLFLGYLPHFVTTVMLSSRVKRAKYIVIPRWLTVAIVASLIPAFIMLVLAIAAFAINLHYNLSL